LGPVEPPAHAAARRRPHRGVAAGAGDRTGRAARGVGALDRGRARARVRVALERRHRAGAVLRVLRLPERPGVARVGPAGPGRAGRPTDRPGRDAMRPAALLRVLAWAAASSA